MRVRSLQLALKLLTADAAMSSRSSADCVRRRTGRPHRKRLPRDESCERLR